MSEELVNSYQLALDALDALADLLSVLEPCIEMVESLYYLVGGSEGWSSEEWHRLREAKANAAAKLADFENGTDV